MNLMAQTLYEKYGGQETVEKIVISFYEKIKADPTVSPFFINTDWEKQIKHQTAFISFALGGPTYTGRSLEQAHAGLDLQEDHWNAVVSHLVTTLTEFGVEGQDISAIGEALGKLKSSILNQ